MENIAAGLLVLIVIALAWIRSRPEAQQNHNGDEERPPLWW